MSGKRKLKTKRVNHKRLVEELKAEVANLRSYLANSKDLCDVLRNDYNKVKKEYSELEATLVVERRKHSYMRSLYTAVSAHAQSLNALTELIK